MIEMCLYGPRCERTDKVSHMTRASAKLARKMMKASGHTSSASLQVFLCQCGYFHLGSNPTKIPRAILRER